MKGVRALLLPILATLCRPPSRSSRGVRPAGASPGVRAPPAVRASAARCKQRPRAIVTRRDWLSRELGAGGRPGTTRSALGGVWGERREWVEGKFNATGSRTTGGAAVGCGP